MQLMLLPLLLLPLLLSSCCLLVTVSKVLLHSAVHYSFPENGAGTWNVDIPGRDEPIAVKLTSDRRHPHNSH